jgi:chitin disaccharide deacetylase
MTGVMTRRELLGLSLGALAALRAVPAAAGPSLRERFMIVNADDLGLSAEVDRGLFEAHDGGIVTSASLLVDGPDAEAAVEQARKRPKLGLGVHVAFDSRGKWLIDVQDLDVVQRELDRQLDAFVRLTGGPPDHIDSHHHVHRRFNVARLFLDAGRKYRVPVRGFSDVVFVGRFYGQPEFGKTDLSKISVEYLVGLVQSLKPGVSEVSCHPGRLETRPDAIYNRERETELSTLTDERVKTIIAAEGIRLINYRDYTRLRS